MAFFNLTEISIPVSQMTLLLLLSTVALLFGKVKLALLVNYLFTLYWGYGVNRDYLVDSGFQQVDGYTLLYFGFGLIIAALALLGLLSHSK
ncbi:MAG: hypothetical protein KKE57_00995 [Proteobacteria bacterium]|nr:hypothetical protein [Pseudomonadota bacterium]